MLPILLNFFYAVVLVIIFPWFVWQFLRKGKYRKDVVARFWGETLIRRGNRPCIWLHAVSVGEVNLLAHLIDQLQRRLSDVEIVISATTDTGLELARQKYPSHLVFRCPLDFSWSVRRTLDRIRPDVLVLAELEIWPNLIDLASRRGVRVAVINGRLSDSSYRGYIRIRRLVKRLFGKLDVVAVQNQEYATRFQSLGVLTNALHVTGSLKFDGAETNRNNSNTRRLARLAGFHPGDVVFLAGSTQAPEEELAVAVFRELVTKHPQLRLVLVPRHPERFRDVAVLLDRSGFIWQRRSALDSSMKLSADAPRILLVDVIGELAAWWGTADIAYVGGSMGNRGGQNMIEPAAYGAVVSFGPNTKNFRDVVRAMLAVPCAVVVHNRQELARFVERAIEDQQFAESYGQAARQLVAGQLGATARTTELLVSLMHRTEVTPDQPNCRLEEGHGVLHTTAPDTLSRDRRLRDVKQTLPVSRGVDVDRLRTTVNFSEPTDN